MPTRERSFERLVFFSPTDAPSTIISPFWKLSRPFTHLMSVDFPDPEGPQTTTTSPLLTSVLQSFNTWKSPYHFETFLIEIIRLFSFAVFAQASMQQNRLRDRLSQETGSIRRWCRRGFQCCTLLQKSRQDPSRKRGRCLEKG